jgi:hypothetical protein
MMARPRGEMAAMIERLAAESGGKSLSVRVPDVAEPPGVTGKPAAKEAPPARYTRPGDDGMTGLEREFAAYLEARRVAGDIWRWDLHPFKLLVVRGVPKSAEAEGVRSSWYEPDFVVYENDGSISIYETKGFHDAAGDGWLKFRAVASRYPFRFYYVRKVSKAKGTWDIVRHR